MFSFIQFITLTKFAKNALKTAYIPKVQMELGLHNISDERTKKNLRINNNKRIIIIYSFNKNIMQY